MKKNFSDLSVYTATLYGTDKVSKLRQKLAEKLLKNIAGLGINCVVIDGGSNEYFLKKVRSYKNVKLAVKKGLTIGQSRRKALWLAMKQSGISYFLWTEPEKYGLIKKTFLQKMIAGLRKNEMDVMVPRRLSKKSYPRLQAGLETKANIKAKRLMGKKFNQSGELDLWFGPKMFNRTGARFFLNYKGRLDKWDSIIKPVLEAWQGGKRVSSVDIDYKHDFLQTSAEEKDKVMKKKRMEQYKLVLAELNLKNK